MRKNFVVIGLLLSGVAAIVACAAPAIEDDGASASATSAIGTNTVETSDLDCTTEGDVTQCKGKDNIDPTAACQNGQRGTFRKSYLERGTCVSEVCDGDDKAEPYVVRYFNLSYSYECVNGAWVPSGPGQRLLEDRCCKRVATIQCSGSGSGSGTAGSGSGSGSGGGRMIVQRAVVDYQPGDHCE